MNLKKKLEARPAVKKNEADRLCVYLLEQMQRIKLGSFMPQQKISTKKYTT